MEVLTVPHLVLQAWQLYNPFVILRNLWRYRDLIQQLTRREVGQRYRGSYLGVLWSFITPLVMLVIYTFVFSVIFKARWRAEVETPPTEFALTLFAGLAAFNFFSEVVNRAPTLILSAPNYVKKVVFPLEILPVVVTGSALVNSLIAVILVMLGDLLLMQHVSPTALLLPLIYLPLILLTLGFGWFLASLGVYIRDTGQGIGLMVQILLFLSPVFYPISSVPEELRGLLLANPMTYILTWFRQALLWNELPDVRIWSLFLVLASSFAVAGYTWFTKTKKGFADVL